MAASRERAVARTTSGLIGGGEEVTWEARHFGRLWRMTSRISEYDRPRRFVDEMVRGPFVSFRHEHRFEPGSSSPGGGGTVMTDVVEFRMRAGAVLDLPTGRYLRRLLTARNGVIRNHAENR